MTDDRNTTEFKRARIELLNNQPWCHWCLAKGKQTPATEADHLIPVDAGGTWRDGLVASCKPCNSARGATHVNKKRAIQQQQRKTFFESKNDAPPTPSFLLSGERRGIPLEGAGVAPLGAGIGRDEPRLVTPALPSESFGPSITRWASEQLGLDLFPWQQVALEGAFAHDADLNFLNATALTTTGRQNGKSTMLAAIVGWALLELPRLWGRPVRIMSAAHELNLATEVWRTLEDKVRLWEEADLCKAVYAYGRNEVRMRDGSIWKVQASGARKHGGTWDIIIGDELWAISEETVFGAWRPSQIAVPSPILFLTSTAGDESSKAFIKLREQALGAIDAGEAGDLFMAEWSLPPGVDPLDETYWGYANPALGRTITLKGLRSAAAAPDRGEFLRAHCNLWVAAAQSWMPPGRWAQARTDDTTGTGGWLAVDSALDDSKYVGVWARVNDAGEIVTSVAFATESNAQMWERISEWLERDTKLRLGITPGLAIHTPEQYRPRTQEWGYGELLKLTGLVRSLILEGKIKHDGGEMLAEHVNRAVLVKAQGSVALSSQRSPGPIEAARCLVIAAANVSRPTVVGKASIGFG